MAGKVQLAPLTGLRFVAAFSILFNHTVAWCLPFNDTRVATTLSGVVAVYGMPLFFVLSGFVIHYNYGPTLERQPPWAALRAFLSARFARIYPLYFFFAVFGAISDFTVSWVYVAPHQFLTYLLHAATLTQSWVYEIAPSHHVLLANGFGLAWSLSCELFFYLCYPLFVSLLLRLRTPRSAVSGLALYSLAVFGALSAAFLNLDMLMDVARRHVPSFVDVDKDFENSFYRWLFYYSPYVRVWEFILGCLAAQLFHAVESRPVSPRESARGMGILYAMVAILAAFGALQAIPMEEPVLRRVLAFFSMNFGCAVPIGVAIFCLVRYETAFSRLLSLGWLVWLGEISYSIYAVHTWTLRVLVRPPVGISVAYSIDAMLRVTFAFAFTIIVASATYAIIEVPCRRFLRDRLMLRARSNIVESDVSILHEDQRVANYAAAGMEHPKG